MTDGWIENDSESNPKKAEAKLKASLNPIVGLMLKVALEVRIESKLEGALRPIVGSRLMAG